MAGHTKFMILIVLMILVNASCTNDTNELILPPVSEQTSSLEAAYVNQVPDSPDAAYWTTADFMIISAANIVTQQVEGTSGLLNMNGMYNGLADFNQGSDAELTLKAAYDDVNIYVLVTWHDQVYNVSQANWLYNGPKDPLKGNEDRFGWTSQQNDDKVIFSFENTSGERDVWKWSLALSEPVGYAIDMHGSEDNWLPDSGTPLFERNIKNLENLKSGPKYQWNGQDQEVSRSLAGSTILDPAFYLFNKTEFSGDIIKGESTYQVACGFCHGKGGDGNGSFQNSGVAMNTSGRLNRYTQQQFDNIIGNTVTHKGARYWNGLTTEEQINLGARLRAFAGIPGYVLQTPDGSSADVKSVSNVQMARIDLDGKNNGYQLLLIRRLNTGNDDDVQFTAEPGMIYNFNIYLTDNDHLNLIGGLDNQLIFVK